MSETQITRRKPEQAAKLLRKADEEMTRGKSAEDFYPGKATTCPVTGKTKVPL